VDISFETLMLVNVKELPATESTGSGKAGTSPPATVVGVPSSVKLQMAMTPLMRLAAASYARAASSAESKVPSHSLQLCTKQDTCCNTCVENEQTSQSVMVLAAASCVRAASSAESKELSRSVQLCLKQNRLGKI